MSGRARPIASIVRKMSATSVLSPVDCKRCGTTKTAAPGVARLGTLFNGTAPGRTKFADAQFNERSFSQDIALQARCGKTDFSEHSCCACNLKCKICLPGLFYLWLPAGA